MNHLGTIIEDTMQLADDTAKLFYQQKNKEGFKVLESVINKIMLTVSDILKYQSENNVVIFDDLIFNTLLTDAVKAIENKDMVLFADILVYEVNDELHRCLNRV